MQKAFNETKIPEQFLMNMDKKHLGLSKLGEAGVYKFADVLFETTSILLGQMKLTDTPQAIIFREANGTFIVGAKVEYITNEDNPSDLSAGQWNYSWSFYEEDFEDAHAINACEHPLFRSSYASFAGRRHGIEFNDTDFVSSTCIELLECIKSWLKNNATSGESTYLVLDKVFTASAAVNDEGEIEIAIVPSGEMKVLIKDDSMIQEK